MGFKAAPQSDHLLKLVYQFSVAACIRLHPLLTRSSNIHVRDGITQAQFVQMRTARDASLAVPQLILPAVQVNLRAGKLPPVQDDGRAYIQVPINAFLNDGAVPAGL